MFSAMVTVKNKSGLHARPASIFTELANEFTSEVTVNKGDIWADAKSILFLLAIGIFKGNEIKISAVGPDEEEAVKRLIELVESGFGEE